MHLLISNTFSYFFGTMSVLAFTVATLCGAIGYFAASIFVRRIFAYKLE